MTKGKHVTIMLIPDESQTPREWHVRTIVLKFLAVAAGLVVLGIILFFVFYGSMVARSAMAERLRAENEDLKRYRDKVRLLESSLAQTQQVVRRLTQLAGVEDSYPALEDDSVVGRDSTLPPSLVNRATNDSNVPAGLPVQGYITKNFDDQTESLNHAGIDIACPIGTPVLATGAGDVAFAGLDSTYGNMVVIKHNDSASSMYGHNDRLLVTPGQHVELGQKIALSGSTGRSTAPHVHYEIRINDKPLNPLDNPYEKTIQQ